MAGDQSPPPEDGGDDDDEEAEGDLDLAKRDMQIMPLL